MGETWPRGFCRRCCSPASTQGAGQPRWLQEAAGAADHPFVSSSCARAWTDTSSSARHQPSLLLQHSPPDCSVPLWHLGWLCGPAILLPLQSCSSPCKAVQSLLAVTLVPTAPVQSWALEESSCLEGLSRSTGMVCMDKLSPYERKFIGFVELKCGIKLDHLWGHEITWIFYVLNPKVSAVSIWRG